MKNRCVLIVDDSEINRQILENIIAEDYETVCAENGQQALDIIRADCEKFSAILLDLVMPVMDGYTFLKVINGDRSLSQIPVIVTTQNDSIEAEAEALESGATDFLTKPYKPLIIKRRLNNIIKLRETATLINTVERDVLTGVYSREFFYCKAREVIDSQPDMKFDLISTDVDRFKLINDVYGTTVGDELLKLIATKILDKLGNRGICGRMNSDNFCILLPHFEYTNDVFESAIREINLFNIIIKLNVRYGIYVIDDRDIAVNIMCDRAKLAGDSIKGRYDLRFAYYDDSIRQRLLHEQTVTDDMKSALVDGEFKVYYQPKYDLVTEAILGAEALVRWQHHDKGMLTPDSFIPLFEKNGFITDLDYYVWDTVCRDIRQWMDEKKDILPVSVNVSRADIYNPKLPQMLLNLVSAYQISPQQLHLEITETAYTENPKQIIEVLSRLKNLGFIIEMDDFGTGYSSLNTLSELPIDVLKLDMHFLQSSGKTNSKNILSFIISLAKWLGLSVVAEGVETIEQVAMLRAMGCTHAQGYYYARPMDRASFDMLLEQSQYENRQQSDGNELMSDVLSRIDSKKTVSIILLAGVVGDDLKVLKKVFLQDFSVVVTNDLDDTMQYIDGHRLEISAVLIGSGIGKNKIFGLLKYVKSISGGFISTIITLKLSESDMIKAIECGVSDFWIKPFSEKILIRRAQNLVTMSRVASLEHERSLALAVLEMRQRAEEDKLTGLLNRAELQARIEMFFIESLNADSAFVIIDIDNFKSVNDLLGHMQGDNVLVNIAKTLKACFDQTTIISRLGGDEFVVFLPYKITKQELKQKLDMFTMKSNFMFEGINISCSLGACICPECGDDYTSLYKNADMALLAAKRTGKNKYKIFSNEMSMPKPVNFKYSLEWLFDEIDTPAYICDSESYETLYINDAALSLLGQKRDDVVGSRCYESIWGGEKPCDRCRHIYCCADSVNIDKISESGAHYNIVAKEIEFEHKKVKVHIMHKNP